MSNETDSTNKPIETGKRKIVREKRKIGKRKFECDLCYTTFSSLDGFDVHKLIHQHFDQIGYKCQVCEKDCVNVYRFQKHLSTHTDTDKILTCRSCGTTFKHLQTYIRHVREYPEEHFFPCKHCGKVFKRLQFLNSHYCSTKKKELNDDVPDASKNVQDSDDITFQNEDSDFEIKDEVEVEDKKPFEEDISDTEVRSVLNEEVLNYQCGTCKWVFTSKASLKRHVKTYSDRHFVYPCCNEILKANDDILKHTCEVPDVVHEKENINNDRNDEEKLLVQDPEQVFIKNEEDEDAYLPEDDYKSVSSGENEEPPEEDKPYKCNNCSISYFRLRSLKNHLKKFPNNHNFSCKKCKKFFPYEDSLNKHLCAFQTGDFQCSCLQYFTSMKKLLQHTGKNAPFFCCACNKKSKNFNSLIHHIRTHTKEKPYKCSFCKKLFAVKESLVTHERIHSGDKPYKCSKCSYSCTTKWNLQLHERKHDPDKSKRYLCAECGASFYMKHHLRRHLSTHRQGKDHLCKVCGKLFKQKGYLLKHMTVYHKNDFKCPGCELKLSKKDMYPHHVETGHFTLVCDPCQRVFTSSFHHTEHTKRHKKDKDFGSDSHTCRLCGKKLARKTNLQKHMELHTDPEKSFGLICDFCGKFFSKRSMCKKHMLTHKS